MTARARLTSQQIVGTVYVTAMFMSILDSTIVNVALPSVARDFHVNPPATDGMVVGYLVSLAVWIPASGWIGDRIGTKRVFLLALGFFTAASMACGLAQSVSLLVAFRVVQGIGGGMLAPVGMAMLFRAYAPEDRARAARVLMIPTMIAPALGPVIGGLLVDSLSWRWVFYVNVPIGVVAFVFGLIALTEHRERAREPFDLPGFVLAGSGFGLLLFALAEAASTGWAALRTLATATAGIVLIVFLVVVELRQRTPMIDFRILRNRLFGVINLASLFAASGFIGLLFIATIYLQSARGMSAIAAGSSTAPEAVGVLVSSQLVGRIYPRIGPRRLMVGGMLLIAAASVLLSLVMTGDLWVFRAVTFTIGCGWAFVVIPMNAGAFAQISSRDTGRASALYNAQRQIAAALGVATLATIVGSQLSSGAIAGNVDVFREAFLAAAVFALAGAIVALGIRDRDAASTMGPSARENTTAIALT
jgi:EmrB/QacA subfamily drug resistance transporter